MILRRLGVRHCLTNNMIQIPEIPENLCTFSVDTRAVRADPYVLHLTYSPLMRRDRQGMQVSR